MYCDSCGAENRDGARFCSTCGTPLPGLISSDATLTTPPPSAQIPESLRRALASDYELERKEDGEHEV